MVLQTGYGLGGGWVVGVVVCFGLISVLIIVVISGWVLFNMVVSLVFILGVGLRLDGFFFKVSLVVVGWFLCVCVCGRPLCSGPPWNCSNIFISPWLTLLAGFVPEE